LHEGTVDVLHRLLFRLLFSKVYVTKDIHIRIPVVIIWLSVVGEEAVAPRTCIRFGGTEA